MEVAIQPQPLQQLQEQEQEQPAAIKPPDLHRLDRDGNYHKKKTLLSVHLHRPAWFRNATDSSGDKDGPNDETSNRSESPSHASQKNLAHSRTSSKSKSRSIATKKLENPYSISLPIGSDNDDFTTSVTKSLELAQKNVQLDIARQFNAQESSKAPIPSTSSASSTGLSKMRRSNSLRNKFSKLSQSPVSGKDSDSDLDRIFPDRRKLNAKELQLELSRGYNEIDCDMKRSSSFRRPTSILSRESSVKHTRKGPETIEEQPTTEHRKDEKTVAKNPSTPVRTSVTHSISAYLSVLGLPTPPSSSKKQQEEKAREAHELKKQSIRHLTPPHTPSRTYPTTLIPIPGASESGAIEPERTTKSPDSDIIPAPKPNSRIFASSDISTEDEFIPDASAPPQRWNISTPQAATRSSSPGDGLFENPRPLPQQPIRHQEISDRPLEGTAEFAFDRLRSPGDPSSIKSGNGSYDIQAMILPVVAIVTTLGLPNKVLSIPESNQRTELGTTNTSLSSERLPNSDSLSISHRTSLRVKTVINALPRRPFSRASIDIKSSRNSPYIQNSTTSSFENRVIVDDIAPSTVSEDSSVENLQSYNTPTPTSVNAPVSAFDDDSSDDDYFGDLIQLPGLGARNLRRRKTNTRRFSRDSVPLSPERPFSRLSFSPKQDRLDSPKESEYRQVSTENFVPIHQISIPEEAQLSTSAGTFNKSNFGALRHIRDTEVFHLKDGDGYDHLVLEQEDGRNVVVAGTLDCLMLELSTAFETGDDDAFIDVFLRSSSLFTTPTFILKGLSAQFRNANSRAQERILLLLDRWLRTLPEDILETELAKETFLMFIGEISYSGQHQFATRLIRTYTHMKEKLQHHQSTSEEIRKVLSQVDNPETGSFPENLKLLFSDESVVLEVAQYLTAIDLVLFRDASHSRILSLWWMSQTVEEQDSWSWDSDIPYVELESKNAVERVHRLLRRSINFKIWIQHEIFSMENVQDRADLISSLINLALVLREQGNFQSCLTILEALATDIIIDLEKTWDCVSIEKIREFSNLKALFDQKTFFTTFSKSKDFAIPYFPFFIRGVALLLNRSTNASFRYSDASKVHVDGQLDSTLYRPSTASSSDKSNKGPPALLDFKKYRFFIKEITTSRAMARYPPSFVFGIDRRCPGFRSMDIGRLAFPRDATSSTYSTRTRSRSGSASSLVDEDPEAGTLNQVSEIIEGRINTILGPIFESNVPKDKNKKQLLSEAVASLHMSAKEEPLTSWLDLDTSGGDPSGGDIPIQQI